MNLQQSIKYSSNMEILQAIELDAMDQLELEMQTSILRELKAKGRNTDFVLAVNNGIGNGFIEVHLKDREEFLIFNLFLKKIRRESAGMVESKHERRVAWVAMAQAFVNVFGDSAPPDIVQCIKDIREAFLDK